MIYQSMFVSYVLENSFYENELTSLVKRKSRTYFSNVQRGK